MSFEMYFRRSIDTVVSIGTGGQLMATSGGEHRSNLSWGMTAVELATDSERTARRFNSYWHIVRQIAETEVSVNN